MTDKDFRIQKLTQEAAKWKNRALEACEKACFHCEEYMSRKDCRKCRIQQIREEASK